MSPSEVGKLFRFRHQQNIFCQQRGRRVEGHGTSGGGAGGEKADASDTTSPSLLPAAVYGPWGERVAASR